MRIKSSNGCSILGDADRACCSSGTAYADDAISSGSPAAGMEVISKDDGIFSINAHAIDV